MATHSSILAWRIPWTEEPGGLLFMRSQESDMTYGLNHQNIFRMRECVYVWCDRVGEEEAINKFRELSELSTKKPCILKEWV